jgi:membrane associated rhomboid family serine protease
MMPIGDDNSNIKTAPIVTWILIALNILFFLLELAGGDPFIKAWSFIPADFIRDPVANIPTLFTSMFMHAGFAHLFGNMLYLWIFGDNVEDVLGRVKYLLFYLVSGLVATFAQLAAVPDSAVPNLGASGAIAGILGAYIYLFPKGRVKAVLGNMITEIPALVAIGFWFVLQFISGIGSLASTGEEGGVAYMAHVGGFVAGLLMAMGFSGFTRLRGKGD